MSTHGRLAGPATSDKGFIPARGRWDAHCSPHLVYTSIARIRAAVAMSTQKACGHAVRNGSRVANWDHGKLSYVARYPPLCASSQTYLTVTRTNHSRFWTPVTAVGAPEDTQVG